MNPMTRRILLALAATFLAWPAAQAGAKFDCAAYEVVLGARSKLPNGDSAQVGKYYFTGPFEVQADNWSLDVLADAWRQHARKTLPRSKGTELITSCSYSERYTARDAANLTLGKRGDAAVWHYAGEVDVASRGGQQVPFEPPSNAHFAKAPAKRQFQCAVVQQPERITFDRYDQGASVQRTKIFVVDDDKAANAATYAFGSWANAQPGRHAWLCTTAVSAEGVTSNITAFLNKYKPGIPVTAAAWTPPVEHATAKPTGQVTQPALTIEGPSKSDRDHAAREKARTEKAKVDDKKAQDAQAKRNAATKAEYDKLAADAAKAKAKAKAEREAALAACAAKGIAAEKCPARASAQ